MANRTESPSGSGRRTSIAQLMPIFVFLVIAGFFAYALQSGDPSKLPSALIGKPVPASEFPAIEGLDGVKGFTSADLADGKIKAVNFWASWCGPCVDEHPLLGELKAASGIEVFGVNYKDQAANARRFLSRYGNPYAAAGTDSSGRTAIEWGVYGMPETFIVNGRGEIVYKHVGPITVQSLKARVLPLIASEQAKLAADKAP